MEKGDFKWMDNIPKWIENKGGRFTLANDPLENPDGVEVENPIYWFIQGRRKGVTRVPDFRPYIIRYDFDEICDWHISLGYLLQVNRILPFYENIKLTEENV